MEEDDLIKAWGKLSLSCEEENTLIRVPRISLDGFSKAAELGLIGKLICQRPIPPDAILRTFAPVWNLENSLSVRGLSKNVYLFKFQKEMDIKKVLRNGPWFFDRSLLVFESLEEQSITDNMDFKMVSFWIHLIGLPFSCMNRSVATMLGNGIGEFLEVDSNEDGDCWGPSLRIRVNIDISKPLRRGIKFCVENNPKELWVEIKYERLPDFCFFCGLIGHTHKDCDFIIQGTTQGNQIKKEYGLWMKYIRQPNFFSYQKKSGSPESKKDKKDQDPHNNAPDLNFSSLVQKKVVDKIVEDTIASKPSESMGKSLVFNNNNFLGKLPTRIFDSIDTIGEIAASSQATIVSPPPDLCYNRALSELVPSYSVSQAVMPIPPNSLTSIKKWARKSRGSSSTPKDVLTSNLERKSSYSDRMLGQDQDVEGCSSKSNKKAKIAKVGPLQDAAAADSQPRQSP